MQTKNVNLPQPADCSAPLSSETNQHPPQIQPPPPLPPRGPGQQLSPADGAAKPVPPPYRQPPNPQGPQGALSVTPLSTEGLIPGMMMAATTSTSGETLATFVTHSSKFPVSREREIGGHGSGVVEKKIPLLAELTSRGGPTRQRNPNAASSVSPRANAWADKRHQPRPLHQRLRTLLSHSPVEHNQEQRDGDVASHKVQLSSTVTFQASHKDNEGEGETLLIRPRKHSSVPEGIDNPGLEKLEVYVPSQPHQRVQGPRGHLILERPPPAIPPSGEIYRALRVIPTAEDEHRSPGADPSCGNWSASEDGHTTHRLRDACSRLYHRGNSAISSSQAFKGSTSTPSLYGSAKSLPEYAVHQPPRPPSCGPQRYYMLKDMVSGEDADEEAGVIVDGHEQSPRRQPNAESPRTTKLDTSGESEATGGSSSYFSAKGNENTSNNRSANRHNQRERRGSGDAHTMGSTTVSESMSVTPPLPPLSPGNSPPSSPKPVTRLLPKYKLSLSSGALHKTTPDILEATPRRGNTSSSSRNFTPSKKSSSRRSGGSHEIKLASSSSGNRRHSSSSSTVAVAGSRTNGHYGRTSRSTSYHQTSIGRSLSNIHELHDAEFTSTTTGLDTDSLLDDAELSSDERKGHRKDCDDEDDDEDDYDGEEDVAIHDIRQQLEALENMYSEVLNLLGVKNPLSQQMQQRSGRDSAKPSRKKVFGSLTSLTGRGNARSKDRSRVSADTSKKLSREARGVGRRFQRLESHVVTLARSVAHLSSEMRTQHIMFQELESLRREVAQLHEQQVALARLNQAAGQMKGPQGGGPMTRGAGRHPNNGRQNGATEWENFRSSVPSLTNPARVKKLTQFFGDEPPLLRLFLKKLGYEKYAVSFETERIGMIELPYLTEEQLQKIGIPLGPRMRILQEAQMSFRQEHFNIYIV